MRRLLAPVLVLATAAALVGCGDDGASSAASNGGDGPSWCAALAADDLSERDADVVPEQDRDAARLVIVVTQLTDALTGKDTEGDEVPVSEAARRLADGQDELTLLGEHLEADCGKATTARARVADAERLAEIAGAERSDVYCDALEQIANADGTATGAEVLAPLSTVSALVPSTHREALDHLLNSDKAALAALSREELVRYVTSVSAIGMYAEATCGIPRGYGRVTVGMAFAKGGLPTDGATTTTA